MTRREELPGFVQDALEDADDAELAAIGETLGLLAAAIEPEPVSGHARQRLLQAVDDPALRFSPFFDRLSQLFDLGLDRVREITAQIDDAANWESGPMPGVRLLHFAGGPRVAAADNGLVQLEPGLAFPKHRHLGAERVLILAGAYRDDSGRVWRAGDLHASDPSIQHSYVVLEEGPCLQAVSIEGGIWIEGMPGPIGGSTASG
jgi:hypothetical protein